MVTITHDCLLGMTHDSGVQVDGEVLPADAVVIALGPWTNTLASSLQLPHISGQLGHSMVLKASSSASSSDEIPADCLFLSWQSKSGDAGTDASNIVQAQQLNFDSQAVYCGSVADLGVGCSSMTLTTATTPVPLGCLHLVLHRCAVVPARSLS